MRLWSLHPKHLDGRGLVTAWREGLLARAVLGGKTRGYRHHPQLERFRAEQDPIAAVDCFLSRLLDEARARGYIFDSSKIRYQRCRRKHLHVTRGQLAYEWKHLLGKLAVRSPAQWKIEHNSTPHGHPCFRVTAGPVATWERIPRLRSS